MSIGDLSALLDTVREDRIPDTASKIRTYNRLTKEEVDVGRTCPEDIRTFLPFRVCKDISEGSIKPYIDITF